MIQYNIGGLTTLHSNTGVFRCSSFAGAEHHTTRCTAALSLTGVLPVALPTVRNTMAVTLRLRCRRAEPWLFHCSSSALHLRSSFAAAVQRHAH